MSYNRIQTEDMKILRAICDNDRVQAFSDIHEDYTHDELHGLIARPEVLVEATSTKEVAEIMKYATARNIPVTPRGQGTGLVGGAVSLDGGIMLSLQKMNRIIELDSENLILTVEPGVLLMEIIAFVDQYGLLYPPDPGEKSATIGGNISTNAGGMRAVKYGVTRDYVLGLEVVIPKGDVLQIGGKVVKNSSGYDIKDLIIGSEGTLGIVTKAILKLVPAPLKVISLLVPFPDVVTAIKTVPKIISSRFIPTAIEFMEREVIIAAEDYLGKKFPEKTANAYLLISFDGNVREQIENIYRTVADICLAEGALDVHISNTEERNEAIWSARGAFLEGIKASTTEMDECDVVVPRNRVADFMQFIQQLKDHVPFRILSFGHAGDGNIHVYVLKDELDTAAWRSGVEAVFEQMYTEAARLGGLVSGEHGIGIAKRSYLIQSLDEGQKEIMRGIKSIFDPMNILNPGKVCP